MTAVLAEVLDPDGRRVVLDEVAWEHILFGHPAMGPAQLTVLEVVERPTFVNPTPLPDANASTHAVPVSAVGCESS